MERYTDSKKIQMYCTTTLYYLVRCHLTQVAMNIRVKQKIISTLLNVMYAHRHDTTIVRNGCLTICQFQLPHDVVLINYKLYLQNSKHERSCYLGRKIYNLSTFSAAACLEKKIIYINLIHISYRDSSTKNWLKSSFILFRSMAATKVGRLFKGRAFVS